MSTTKQQRETGLAEVHKVLSALAEVEADSLGRKEELATTINFEDAVPELTQILQIFKDLSGRTLDRLSRVQLKLVADEGRSVEDLLQKVRSFSLETGDAKANSESIKEEIYKKLDSLITSLSPILAFTATQATDYAKIEREAQGLLSRIDANYKLFDSKIKKYNADMSSALSAIQQQAADAGVSQNAEYFKREADDHLVQADKWRYATIIVIAVTVLVAAGFMVSAYFYVPDSMPVAVQLVAAKVIAISVLSFAMIWCSKNYRSHRHNYTVDTHRKNALSTFRTFIEGSDNDGVKEAILLAAADAAFSSRATGYDTPEPENGSVNAQQAETVLRIAMRSGGTQDHAVQ